MAVVVGDEVVGVLKSDSAIEVCEERSPWALRPTLVGKACLFTAWLEMASTPKCCLEEDLSNEEDNIADVEDDKRPT